MIYLIPVPAYISLTFEGLTQEHQKGTPGVFNAVHVAKLYQYCVSIEMYLHPPFEDTQKLPLASKDEAVI